MRELGTLRVGEHGELVPPWPGGRRRLAVLSQRVFLLPISRVVLELVFIEESSQISQLLPR